MRTLSYTAVRGDLAKTMTRVCEDHEPILVTRKSSDPLVLLSLEDYEALNETAYLMRKPQKRAAADRIGRGARGGRGAAAGTGSVRLVFSSHAWDDYLYWQRTDP